MIDTNPLNVTLEEIEAYNHKRTLKKVYNEPIRNIESQDVWDFMLEPLPEADREGLSKMLVMAEGALS
jgi:hypothetical protein